MCRLLLALAAFTFFQTTLQSQVCFYVADESDALYSFDFKTESDSEICPMPAGVTTIECLAYDAVRAVLYSSFNGKILEINPRNCSVVEKFEIPHLDVDAIEYYNDTIVLSVRALEVPDTIVSYRLSTGKKLSGPFPIEGPGVPLNIDGLAFNPCEEDPQRKLYATLNNEGNGDSLFCINPMTGEYLLVGAMSTSDIESISFTAFCELFAIKGKKPSSIWAVNPETAELSNQVVLTGSDVEGFACDPIYLFFKDGQLVSPSIYKKDYFEIQDLIVGGFGRFPGMEIEIHRKFQDAEQGIPLERHLMSDRISEISFSDEVPGSFSDVTYCVLLTSSEDRPIMAKKQVELGIPASEILRIFPNPTSRTLQLQLNTYMTDNPLYIIRDQVGKPVIQADLVREKKIHSLDVSHLPFGYYSIEVYAPEEVLIERFFIAR